MRARKITASAPNKAIITGEHFIVYGSRGIVIPVEIGGKRNKVTLKAKPGKTRITFKGDLGKAAMDLLGNKTGAKIYHPMLEGVENALEKLGVNLENAGKMDFSIEYSGAPKGTGNSASIPAAAILTIAKLFNKKLSSKELHSLTHFVDDIYHGGKASGIDSKGVTSTAPHTLRKKFSGKNAVWEFEPSKIKLPKGTALILVDSMKARDGKTPANSTSEMISIFAKKHGISKAPVELSEKERKRITAAYSKVFSEKIRQLKSNGNATRLGRLFDKNHALLESVSTKEIEQVISVGKTHGALGGKITGAGGVGGAVLLLCRESDFSKITRALKTKGFASWKVKLAQSGPRLESSE